MKSKFKFNGIFIGVVLLAIAVCMILSGMKVIPANSYLILMTIIMGAIAIRSAISLQFSGMFFGLGHLAHLYRGYLHIPDSFAPWMLILASLLVGVALDIIFKNLKNRIKNSREGVYVESDNHIGGSFGEANTSSNQSDFHIENGFNTQTHYVRTSNFVAGHVENGFGTVTVYFDEVAMAGGHANLHLENGFGSMNLYLPATWALDLHQENGLGNIEIKGNPSVEPGAPTLHVHAENGFGKIILNFN